MSHFGYKRVWVLAAALMMCTAAQARDDEVRLSIRDALNTPAAQAALDPKIKFVFGGGGGTVIRAGLTSRQSANSVGRSDEVACHRAFLNTLLQFQKRAIAMGGRRVVNIRTYFDKKPLSSSSQYLCHAGGVVARVTMRADIAR